MSALSEEDLALLTPEEVAAIQDPEYNAQEREALAAIAAQAGDDAGDDPPNGDDDAGGDTSASADDNTSAAKPAATVPDASADSKATEAAATQAPAVAPSNEENKPFIYEAKLPDNFEAQVLELAQKQKEAWDKFDSGELDRNALEAELQAVEQTRASLNAAKLKAELSAEMTQQSAEQQWQRTINSFLSSVAAEVDYSKDADKQTDLDQFVKVLAANPAHNDKPMDWFLAEGHKRVMALHGVTPRAADASAANNKNSRTPPVGSLPKTLANVAGSDGAGDVASEFASLDKLEGLDLEAALTRMTPAQREKYLKE